jgi:hypothetical protein
MKRLALLACLLIVGCESTRDFAKRHPVATGIGAALLVGSIAASANHGDSNKPATAAEIGPVPSCTPQPNGSCR